MKRIISFISVGFLLIGLSGIKAQQLSVYVNSLNGIVTENSFVGGSRGISLGIDYLHPIKNNFNWLGGIEFNSVSWGNNMVANIGLNYSQIISDSWSWSVTAQTQQGIALFKPAFYSWGLSGTAAIEYNLTAATSLSLGTGLRFYNCPEYKKYSSISYYVDFPIEISYHIRLNN